MYANARKSSISLMIAVLLGGATLAAVPYVTAQDRTQSDPQTRTAEPARGVPSIERSALQTREAPVVSTDGVTAVADGVAADETEGVASIVNYDEDIQQVLVSTAESEADLPDGIAVDTDGAFSFDPEDPLPSVFTPMDAGPQLDQTVQDPPAPPCCDCPAGCGVYSTCPGNCIPAACPCEDA